MVGVQGLGLQVHDEFLGWEIPHLDSLLSSENQPVLLGGEEHAVDGAANIGGSEEFSFNEVPDHSLTVFATGGEVRGLGGHVKGVNLGGVAGESVLQAHGLVVPHLDGLVPRGRHNDGALGVLVELNAGNPVGVSVLFDGELALSDGVPDLQVLISSSTCDLSVVGGEGNCEHVSGVAHESSGGVTFLHVPESQGSVP